MPEFAKRNITYMYDGTFDGFLCCVFESFTHKEIPEDILSAKDPAQGLFEKYEIPTNLQKAKRVKKSIPAKMGNEAFDFLEKAFLSCLEHKEAHMLDFMRLGYKAGPKVFNMLANNTVLTLTKAVKQTAREAQKFMGFVRFSAHGDLLISKIQPKNFVLSLLAEHFVFRLPNEKFVIYDETHKSVCAYAKGRYVISDASEAEFPAPDDTEQRYRDLWKMFYDTIAVEGRENPKCRMTLMPKRYWKNLTEMQRKN